MNNPTTRFPKNNPLMPEDTGVYLKINWQVKMGEIKTISYEINMENPAETRSRRNSSGRRG